MLDVISAKKLDNVPVESISKTRVMDFFCILTVLDAHLNQKLIR